MDWNRLLPFGSSTPPPAQVEARPPAGSGVMAYSLNDPFLIDYLRDGNESASGATVSAESAMRNPAFFRAMSLIANSIGMLPLHLMEQETKAKAKDHAVYKLLHRRPNNWQTAFDFRSLMQLRAMTSDRPATALIVRSPQIRGGTKITRLVPLDPKRIEVKQRPDWSVIYEYQPGEGGKKTFAADEIFHLRGLSMDGLNGINLVKQARDAIGLALSAEMAAGRLFKNGSFIGGALKHPGKLSDPAFERLKASLAEKEGAANAGKNLILEEGMSYEQMAQNARDAELSALRRMQVEEIARVTGVPRPLLMVDETSWGSGIQALGQFFVQYALNPWFTAWQQAAERSLLTDDESDLYSVEFNADALLKGSTKDQGDFFAKALGAGGQRPWMTQDEVRGFANLPPKGGVHAELGLGASEAAQADPEGDPDATA